MRTECKHNWHLEKVEAYQDIKLKCVKFAKFICDKCGKTKTIKVGGIVGILP